METYDFVEGLPVIIHSLGITAPGEYRGIIRGRSTMYMGAATMYIVAAIDKIPTDNYHFSHYTVPAACIREA
jgi:hypothetical protein